MAELLLGGSGPLLSVGQRAWLAQLAQRPLRLYDVTDVVSGTGVTAPRMVAGSQPSTTETGKGSPGCAR